jgi:hypothetical protein
MIKVDKYQTTPIPEFSLQDSSRVWIFQSSRFLTEKEIEYLEERGSDFITQWEAHGEKLLAEIKVVNNLFLIVVLDESIARATGCSIDKVMHFVQEFEIKHSISFTNRLIIAWIDNYGFIRLSYLQEFSELIMKGEVKGDTVVYNNLVSTLGELRDCWMVAAESTWLKRYLNRVLR